MVSQDLLLMTLLMNRIMNAVVMTLHMTIRWIGLFTTAMVMKAECMGATAVILRTLAMDAVTMMINAKTATIIMIAMGWQ